MGSCLSSSEKLTAEIVPHDGATMYPGVRLQGSPNSIISAYIRFALPQNVVSSELVPSVGPSPAPPSVTARAIGSEWESPVVLHVGSEVRSDSREALLWFIDARFPGLSSPLPPTAESGGGNEEEMTSLIVRVTRLQHKSMTWHLERVVRWAEDLATRGGRRAVDPKVGSWRMEMRKFVRSYSQLLEVMMEHAQMEEKVLFPIFDIVDRGLSKAAKEEHARDLPIMNGVKEIIKSVEVLDPNSPNYQEALCKLSTRLKSLQIIKPNT